MTELLSFFIVLFAGLIFSELFGRFHIPWVIALIIGGIVIGPFGFDVFHSNPTIDFLGEIGLIFLMFMAGLETRIFDLRGRWLDVARIALLNSLIPLAVGIGIGMLFGYELVPAVLLGIIFVSSSIAIIVPSLQASGLLSTQFGRTIVAAAIFEDIASLILLSIVLQAVNPITRLPLPLFFGILAIFFLVIFLLRSSTAKIRWFFIFDAKHSRDIFERELRMAIALLIGAVIFFQLIGLHAIIAGFFVGLLLSEATKSQILREKIHGIGYSIFIPIFFVLVGSQTNIRIFLEARDAIIITAVVIGGSVLSKFLSGWFAGRLNGLSTHKSVVLGAATTPQLSTTLAVVFTAQGLNLISAELVSALVALSIVTTLIGPLVIAQFARVSAREEERSVALAQAHL